jgi:hypothetical protein
MPAPHSASIRRTYALTAPFTPSAILLARLAACCNSSQFTLSHQRARLLHETPALQRQQGCLSPEQAQRRQCKAQAWNRQSE